MSKTPEIETVDPVQVTVVEPEHDVGIKFGLFIGGLGVTFLIAWFIQLLLPIVLEIQWGYWRCFWALILLRLVMPTSRFSFFKPQFAKKDVKP